MIMDQVTSDVFALIGSHTTAVRRPPAASITPGSRVLGSDSAGWRQFPLGAASRVHSAVVHAAISVAPTEIRLTGSSWSISARELWFVGLVLAVLGGVYAWAAQYWIDPFEEGYFAYLASRVAIGDHPYRDFATPYTPGFFYLHALIFKITGYNLVWQRISVSAARVVGAGL